jgi:hypothetical protein
LLEKARTQCTGTEGDARHCATLPCLDCDLVATERCLLVNLLTPRLNIATHTEDRAVECDGKKKRPAKKRDCRARRGKSSGFLIKWGKYE